MKVWTTLEAIVQDGDIAERLMGIREVVPEVFEVKTMRRPGIYMVEIETKDLSEAGRAIASLSKNLAEVHLRKFATRYISDN